jgi:hypothetical protein
MVSMEAFFDRARAEAFIEALFHVVLDRTKISEVEREYWTSFLIEHQDPTDVLTRFGQSKEYQVRRISLQEAHRGFPPGHFYSPIVNIPEVEQDATRLFTRHASLGVRLNVLEQKKVFGALSDYWKEAPFGDEAVSGLRYYYNNTSYAFGDAFGYWGMLCHFKPNRIIEIGCGFTSALALDAIDHLKLGTTCTFIDPYPDLLLRVAHPISERHNLIAERVQAVDPRIVESLERNDILFIDSSHVLKTGSDVHFEVAELLPRLRSGVVVHFTLSTLMTSLQRNIQTTLLGYQSK